MHIKIIPQGECALVWNARGEARLEHGPKRMFLLNSKIQPLQRYAAEPDGFLIVKHLDGKTEHLPGPVTVWKNPLEHMTIEARH